MKILANAYFNNKKVLLTSPIKPQNNSLRNS